MKFNTLKKSLSICAAALMLINAGGNTLTASARHYSHKRISRKITRKHISRYQYRKNYRLYQRLIKYIKFDQRRLKRLKPSLKRHKHGRLNKNLRKHQRFIRNDLNYHIKLAKRLSKRFNGFKINKKISKRVHKTLTPTEKAAKAKADEEAQEKYVKENNEFVLGSNGVVPASSIKQESNTSTSNSSSSQAQNSVNSEQVSNNSFSNISESSSSADMSSINQTLNSNNTSTINQEANSLANTWYNDPMYGKVYYPSGEDTVSALDAYATQELQKNNNPEDTTQPLIYDLESFENSEETPLQKSAYAWKYINAISGIYNNVNNYCMSHSGADGTAGDGVDYDTLNSAELGYAIALGHRNFSNSNDYLNSQAAAQHLNGWYQEHNISSSTADGDANAWNNRKNTLIVPANFGVYDNASTPAAGTDAGFDQALNDDGADVENGDSDGFNGIENYM